MVSGNMAMKLFMCFTSYLKRLSCVVAYSVILDLMENDKQG